MTCGCNGGDTRIEGERLAAHAHDHGQEHEHGAGPAHEHAHWHRHADGAWHGHAGVVGAGDALAGLVAAQAEHGAHVRVLSVEQDLLAENDRHAARNRAWFAARGIFALNLVSSPGSGKTSLLVRTIEALAGSLPVAVIEGDQQTSRDADRIRATGAPAVQINTGKGCHLDAHMIAHALDQLAPPAGGLLLIENVGNLVCPAAFDLGEAHKVVILSVTEGEDKPLKYPDMFHASDLMLLNKIDLLPYLDFDPEAALDFARRVKPGLVMLRVSVRSGDGFDAWLDWLRAGVEAARAARAVPAPADENATRRPAAAASAAQG